MIELKRVAPGADVAQALDAALEQIRTLEYATALRGLASPVHHIAVVFEGKVVHVRIRREP